MNTYRVWHIFNRHQCTIEALNSFEARKLYAAQHAVDYAECAARRIWNDEPFYATREA